MPHEHILITCQVRFPGPWGDLTKVRVWCFCPTERQSAVPVLRPAVCYFFARLVRAAANSSCEVASFRADLSSLYIFPLPPQGWIQLSTFSLSVLVDASLCTQCYSLFKYAHSPFTTTCTTQPWTHVIHLFQMTVFPLTFRCLMSSGLQIQLVQSSNVFQVAPLLICAVSFKWHSCELSELIISKWKTESLHLKDEGKICF